MEPFILIFFVLFLAVLVCFFIIKISKANTSEVVYSELDKKDKDRLEHMRKFVKDTIYLNFEKETLKGDITDIDLLQKLVDKRVLSHKKRYENQSLGVVFGDILCKELNGQWIMIRDQYGYEPTIYIGEINGYKVTVNSLTIISKRIEENREVNLKALYFFLKNHLEETFQKISSGEEVN